MFFQLPEECLESPPANQLYLGIHQQLLIEIYTPKILQ